MTPAQKTQNHQNLNTIFLYFMPKGYFRPLEAEKAENPIFQLHAKINFCIFWPPEAKNDPRTKNTKPPEFEYNFFVFYAKRLFSAFGG